jgi:hypothetical protein
MTPFITIISHDQLTEDDVLLGRGTGSNGFKGNRRFRALAMEVLVKAKGRNTTKRAMSNAVVSMVHAKGGRFLRKLSKGESKLAEKTLKDNSGYSSLFYTEVSRSVALEKAKQAFRHQLKVLCDTKKSDGELPAAAAVTRRVSLIGALASTNLPLKPTDPAQALSVEGLLHQHEETAVLDQSTELGSMVTALALNSILHREQQWRNDRLARAAAVIAQNHPTSTMEAVSPDLASLHVHQSLLLRSLMTLPNPPLWMQQPTQGCDGTVSRNGLLSSSVPSSPSPATSISSLNLALLLAAASEQL